jgi:hypothetical protein
MLVVVEEGDKDKRHQKVPNQDDRRVQVRVAGQHQDYRRGDKEAHANQQGTQPSATSTWSVLG